MWYEANGEKSRAAARAWAAANKPRALERVREWRQSNPDGAKAQVHRRLARKHGLPSTLTAADVTFAFDVFSQCCAACGRQLNGLFHRDRLDHWIPLASPDCPGTVPHNMVPLCSDCNLSKHARDPVEWLTERFGKRKGREILKRIEAFLESRRTA